MRLATTSGATNLPSRNVFKHKALYKVPHIFFILTSSNWTKSIQWTIHNNFSSPFHQFIWRSLYNKYELIVKFVADAASAVCKNIHCYYNKVPKIYHKFTNVWIGEKLYNWKQTLLIRGMPELRVQACSGCTLCFLYSQLSGCNAGADYGLLAG